MPQRVTRSSATASPAATSSARGSARPYRHKRAPFPPHHAGPMAPRDILGGDREQLAPAQPGHKPVSGLPPSSMPLPVVGVVVDAASIANPTVPRPACSRLCDIDEFTHVVVDAAVPESQISAIEERGVQVIIA